MFLTFVIKPDIREILRLYYILSIFSCFCCFRFFQENYPYAVKVNNFGLYPIFDPLDQANLICVRYFSSKMIKETYLGYTLSMP